MLLFGPFLLPLILCSARAGGRGEPGLEVCTRVNETTESLRSPQAAGTQVSLISWLRASAGSSPPPENHLWTCR